MPELEPKPSEDAGALFVCWTTFQSKEDAETAADSMISEGIAACAQLDSPMKSRYMWEGKLCAETEYRLWLKIPASRLQSARKRISELHPYDTPQWIEIRAEEVEEKYLKWAKDASNFHGFQNQEPE